MNASRLISWKIGRHYERYAKRYLQKQGLVFIAENIRFRGGEIDLIMQDKDIWVFVEVRYRKSSQYGSALDSITKEKRRKLLLAASHWLLARGASLQTCACRFDVCAINDDKLDWLKNAFSYDF